MTVKNPETMTKYRGYISYSHDDADLAEKFHSQIEGYRIPKLLVGKETAKGKIPKNLFPFFRDRTAFVAGDSLRDEMVAALAASEHLIVLCSPSAAASKWVNEEIRIYRELHGSKNIIPVIFSGQPEVRLEHNPKLACYPPALLAPNDGDEQEREPLAADFRPHADGWNFGLLKVIAGIISVPLADLVQSNLQKKMQTVMRITGAAISSMLILGFLTWQANVARAAAEKSRNEAEGLIEFMLTDLKEKLAPLQRLDVMDAIGEQALDYYGKQSADDMDYEQAARRSRAFLMLGEVERDQGNSDTAVIRFQEAVKATEALLAQDPNDPKRIFDHAQSVYWIGEMYRRDGEAKKAKRHWDEYHELASYLVDMSPNHAEYLRERAYSQTNLGILYLRELGEQEAALEWFERAYDDHSRVNEISSNRANKLNIANSHAWLSSTHEVAGNLSGALLERQMQAMVLLALQQSKTQTGNVDYRVLRGYAISQYAIGRIQRNMGKLTDSIETLKSAAVTTDKLVEHDPENQRWRKTKADISYSLALTYYLNGQYADAKSTLSQADGIIEKLLPEGKTDLLATQGHGLESLVIKSLLAITDGNVADVLVEAEEALSKIRTLSGPAASALMLAYKRRLEAVTAEMLKMEGRNSEALFKWRSIMVTIEREEDNLPLSTKAIYARSLRELGKRQEAIEILNELRANGFVRPDLTEMKSL